MKLRLLTSIPFFSLAVFFVAPAASASTPTAPPSVSGTYGDIGFKVGGGEAGAPARASLQALLKLQFSPDAPEITMQTIDRVVIRETPSVFEARGLDRDGAEVWRGSWNSGDQYVAEAQNRVLRLRSEQQDRTAYALVFQPTADGRLLTVEVARLKATHFGPVPETTGIYVFYRVEEKKS